MRRFTNIEEIYREYRANLLPIPIEEDASAYAHENAAHATPSNPIRAVVFDIYGTLVISASGDISLGEESAAVDQDLDRLMADYNIALTAAEAEERLRSAILDAHHRLRQRGIKYPEVDIRAMWAGISELEHLDDKSLELFATEYETLVNPVCPMPGLAECLDAVKNAGLSMGIVSNAQFYTPYMFPAFLGESLGSLGFHPDLMVFSYKTAHGKPSTELYSLLRSRLNNFQHPAHGLCHIKPEECLYVGNDFLKDVWAAKQLGFLTGFFTGDKRSFRPRNNNKLCKYLKADYVIDTLEDIALLLSRNPGDNK